MLDREVRDAVAAGKFRIYTAAHVEEVMELLSGLPRGERDASGEFPEGSFNRMIQDRITELQELHRRFAAKESGEEEVAAGENTDD